MDFKRTMVAAAMAVTVPTAALADGWNTFPTQACQTQAPATAASGRYELRDQQQWTEGRYEPVFVAEQCFGHRGHGRRGFCRPAHQEQRWVPGHFQTVQQWVWVSGWIARR